jgi:hypothetical protein
MHGYTNLKFGYAKQANEYQWMKHLETVYMKLEWSLHYWESEENNVSGIKLKKMELRFSVSYQEGWEC